MSDRKSAEIFAFCFSLLAENPSDEHKAMALALYNFYQEQDYDFSPREMYTGEACKKLGIAKSTDKAVLVFPGEVGFDDKT